MAETSQMPKSIQSDIDVSAVGEALLRHYNMGIENPWFKHGLSDQETYNRRRLPWSGKNYTVVGSGANARVTGPNAEQVPDGLKEQWIALADAAEKHLSGETFGDLPTLMSEGLRPLAEDLSS